MAGIRHHILPRFLLKGFASRTNGKKVFTWVYRKNTRAFEASTKDISVEKNFYGKEGEVSIDAEITDLENEFADLVAELREKPDGQEITDWRVAELITHLCIRTKHLRDSLLESSEFCLEKLEEYLSDFNNFKDIILNDPAIMANAFENKSNDYQISHSLKDKLIPILPNITASLLEQQKSLFQMLVKMFFMEFKKLLPLAVKEGHIKALTKGLVPEPRVEDYRNLRWFVRHSRSPLILGDIGCLFEVSEKKQYKSLNEKDDKIKNIFLPIASNKMLIGTSSSSMPNMNFKYFNKVYVRYNREYFICSGFLPEISSLTQNIGEEGEIISKIEVEQILKKIIAKRNIWLNN